ncbi:blue-light photoreceptor PHR2-like isoform X2 [Punica granatum]|uniref:Blue-light photoreceptor PHR2-like isoform X2 n=2 Tax=Punica granatum TaxID=22663 RepID=A0A218VTE7_PUNGR|nr:blue-light photoreceptor PHR2-like isoform X2 [Punica granatum]OWM63559.1 hypothetical protein CDL15_Pgr019509 [Punica granatum]
MASQPDPLVADEAPETETPPSESQQTPLPALPFAASSLSLSAVSPLFSSAQSPATAKKKRTHKLPAKPSPSFSCLSRLSLSPVSAPPPKLTFLRPTFSPTPLLAPLPLVPRRPHDPNGGAALRRASIVWFRSDLRLSDNECLNAANDESMSVLPVYCFDPRDYGRSSSGFDKTGPYRAKFLLGCVANLRDNLRARGSDLIVRFGRPEEVLVEMAKAIGADALYAHREVSTDEVEAEERIEAAMKDEGVEVKYFWGGSLFHVDDLPFKLEDMPTTYCGFRDKVKGLEVRKTIDALDQLKGLPKRGDVEPGEMPSLVDLGFNPSATMAQNGKAAAYNSLVGGETEAIERLKKYSLESQAHQNKGSSNSLYGADFSCKISPWLTSGCISPRSIFHELKKAASGLSPVASNQNGEDSGSSSGAGTNWWTYELLWRDFFRFITRKYNLAKIAQPDTVPATACTGALA